MPIRSLFTNLSAAFSDIYSGWILWNLFLAFIPLMLSFFLFRAKTLSQPWLWGFCALVGFTGVVGFRSRLPNLMLDQIGLLSAVAAGDRSAQLKILWLMALIVLSSVLSFWLLKRESSLRTWLWWLGFVVFIAFLPNAPYLLTDIIHLIRGTSSGEIPTWVVALVFIPIHVMAILLGFEAYVLSLLNQGYYLKQKGVKQYILLAELLVHALSAIGIYLGRFIRLNSWDLVTDPSNVLLTTLNTLTAKRPVLVIVVTFIILTVFYWLMKQITLGLKLRIQYARLGIDALD
ncbi:MAG: DUF1361 domain-containing protein [Cyanothece sp. SIO1E1]|nr:DUF1361 domain-containing protein [Cyanothece sp. SIO1E1]